MLSQFLGAWGEDFTVALKVKESSVPARRISAPDRLGIEPGDEIIVTPWTMSATATAILHLNAIPVFADIDPETFNLIRNR